MKRFRRWFNSPFGRATCIGFGLMLAAVQAEALLKEHNGRLAALESRGLVPVDDLATIGELHRLRDQLVDVAVRAGLTDDVPEGDVEP